MLYKLTSLAETLDHLNLSFPQIQLLLFPDLSPTLDTV